jgi:hypothetical protein
MARKLRIQFPGAIYHVMNRGDHREEIFRDDLDRHCFLETLEEARNKMRYVEQQKANGIMDRSSSSFSHCANSNI